MTHSHLCAVNFCKLQGAAVKFALEAEQGALDPVKFVDKLYAFMQPHEPSELFGEMQQNRKRQVFVVVIVFDVVFVCLVFG